MKKSPKYRRNQSRSLFEKTQTLEALSKQGNPLEFISGIVDFEMFRPVLEAQLQGRSSPHRPCVDVQSHVCATIVWVE